MKNLKKCNEIVRRKERVKILSKSIEECDNALEQEPQRVIEYRHQPNNPMGFPPLSPSSNILLFIVLIVHLIVCVKEKWKQP